MFRKDEPHHLFKLLYLMRSQSIFNDIPFFSIKIEICTLKGEFGSYGNEC